MKVYLRISALFSMLLFSSMAQGQDAYKKYTHSNSPFKLDTFFHSGSKDFTDNNETNHIWLNTLNSQYVDTTKNKINASAIPAYTPVKKNSLLNPYSLPNQIIGAMLPYASSFQNTPYQTTTYYPLNKSYSPIPYGYSPYSIRAISSPHYILPQF